LDQVDGMEWNEWPQWSGIDGRHPSERVEPFNRNHWNDSAEYAKKLLNTLKEKEKGC